MLAVLTAFLIKHYICDFPLQREYMYLNKGKYGHPGGILHTSVHALGTIIVLVLFGLPVWLGAVADLIAHYHIDFLKVWICNKFNLKPDNSEWYWHILGLDQLMHGLTYVGIVWIVS